MCRHALKVSAQINMKVPDVSVQVVEGIRRIQDVRVYGIEETLVEIKSLKRKIYYIKKSVNLRSLVKRGIQTMNVLIKMIGVCLFTPC